MTPSSIYTELIMEFSERLYRLRKELDMTQQQMADTIGIHVNSLKKYEAGHTQPSLDVIKKMAVSLHISTDDLLFNEQERYPANEKLKLLFEAIERLDEQEQHIIGELLEGMVSKYEANRFNKVS